MNLVVGAFAGFVVWFVGYAFHRFRSGIFGLVMLPAALVTCSLWAEIPDIPRLLGMPDLYFRMARNPNINIFFWHYSIDQIESNSPWHEVGLLTILAAALFIAWRELARAERRKGY
jgi:hypothetical protein